MVLTRLLAAVHLPVYLAVHLCRLVEVIRHQISLMLSVLHTSLILLMKGVILAKLACGLIPIIKTPAPTCQRVVTDQY